MSEGVIGCGEGPRCIRVTKRHIGHAHSLVMRDATEWHFFTYDVEERSLFVVVCSSFFV